MVHKRGGIATCANDCCRQIVVARSGIHDSAQAERFAELATQSPEALRRPAFGAPATAGAHHNVAIKSLRAQTSADCGLILRWNFQAHRTGAALCASAQ